MMIQLGLSSTAFSVQTATGQTSVIRTDVGVTLDEFPRDRTILDSGVQRGLNSVAIPLKVNSVDAPDGAEVEVRFVRADTGAEVHPWRKLAGTLSGGALSGTYFQPDGARSIHWLRAQARVVGSSTVTETETTCGVGHVWAIWAQSEIDRLISFQKGSYNAGPVTRPDDVQVIYWEDGQMTPVNDETKTTGVYQGPVVDMANAISAAIPGQKVAIGFFTQGGNSAGDALTGSGEADDGQDDWDWERNVRAHNILTGGVATYPADGGGDPVIAPTLDGVTQVGAVFIGLWLASHAARHGDPMELWTGLFFSKDKDGNDYPPPASTDRRFHVEAGGLYDMSYTKLGMLGPWTGWRGHDTADQVIPAASVVDHTSWGINAQGMGDIKVPLWNREFDRFFNQQPVPFYQDKVLPWIGMATGTDKGTWRDEVNPWGRYDDMGHWSDQTFDNGSRFLQILTWHMLQSLGLAPVDYPYFDRRHDDPSGSHADMWVSNATELTTYRKWKAANGAFDDSVPGIAQLEFPDASPAGWADDLPTPVHQEVYGFYVNNRPATDATLHTVTQTEADNGHPAPVGTQVVRIGPQVGEPDFATKPAEIWYHPTGEHQLVNEDLMRQSWLDLPTVNVGQPPELMNTVPVMAQGLTPRLMAPTRPTVPTPPVIRPASFGVQLAAIADPGSGKPSFDLASSMIWRVRMKMDFYAFEQRIPHLLSFTFDNCFWRIGAYSMRVKNQQDDLEIFNRTSAQFGPDHPMLHDTWQEWIVRIDPSGTVINPGSKVMDILDGDGNEVIARDPAGLVRGDFSIGSSDQARAFAEMDGDNGIDPNSLQVELMEIYVDKADTTGSPDYALQATNTAPFYSLTGFQLATGTNPDAGFVQGTY